MSLFYSTRHLVKALMNFIPNRASSARLAAIRAERGPAPSPGTPIRETICLKGIISIPGNQPNRSVGRSIPRSFI